MGRFEESTFKGKRELWDGNCKSPCETLLCGLVSLAWEEEETMGQVWLLDVVAEAAKLPPASLASSAGWVVVTFTEEGPWQEKWLGERRMAEKLLDNGQRLPNGATRPNQKRRNTEWPCSPRQQVSGPRWGQRRCGRWINGHQEWRWLFPEVVERMRKEATWNQEQKLLIVS